MTLTNAAMKLQRPIRWPLPLWFCWHCRIDAIVCAAMCRNAWKGCCRNKGCIICKVEPADSGLAAGIRSGVRKLCDGIDRWRFRHPSAHEGDVREAGDEKPNEPCVIEEWA